MMGGCCALATIGAVRVSSVSAATSGFFIISSWRLDWSSREGYLKTRSERQVFWGNCQLTLPYRITERYAVPRGGASGVPACLLFLPSARGPFRPVNLHHAGVAHHSDPAIRGHTWETLRTI